MMDLLKIECEACQIGSPLATDKETAEYMAQLPDWEILEVEGVNRLRKVFAFGDYQSGMDFTNLVGDLAEEKNHHPEILTEWGKVTVTWWTHKIGGLHVTDFVCAARTDQFVAG